MGSLCASLGKRSVFALVCFFCLFVTKFGEDFDSPVMDFMSSHYVSLE